MLFNKIAAAILVVGISAMAIGKISTIILPHSGAGTHAGTGAGPTTPPPDPDPGWPAAMAEADPAAGKRVAGKCVSCHTLNKGGPNRVGPNLYGIAGRNVGSHPGFAYSSAMKGKGGTWTLESLYSFLADPTKAVPGTKMAYRLGKWKQRRDLIAYLASLGDTPVPLPKVAPPKKDAPKKTDDKKGGEKAPEKKTEKMPAKKAAPVKTAAPKKEAAPKKAMPTDAGKDAPKKEAPSKADDGKKEMPAATPGDGDKKEEKKDDNKDGN